MKKKLLFSLMLACIALFVYQGATLAGITGKIAGVITDAATGESLPAVNVVIEGTTLGGATDNEGHYFIINIPPGTYSLQASMVGYAVESKTGVIINVDHTTPVDFNLRVTAIAGEEVTVTAEREIVPMDISASHIVADAEQIAEVPMITDITQYIHLQAGIQGDYIRGGGLDQTQFMMDGLMVVDNRSNKPMMMVNLSSIKELNIIKGGFNAEYGNVRSGLINVVTREGSPSVYHGSFDFRISPPHLKHGGNSIFSPDNYQTRPYLDPAVCWVGTKNGTWDEEKQRQNKEFKGWNAYSEEILADEDPLNNRNPEECRDLFMWLHTVEGCGALGQKGRDYGHRPDWNTDVSFGGPVPFIGKYLGNLSFFASYRTNWEMFGLPTYREYFNEENMNLKLTSRLSPSMKLTLEGLYGDINTVSRSHQGGSDNDYMTSGNGVFGSRLTGSPGYRPLLYWPNALSPFDVYRSMVGISFDHVLSPRTFYNVRISQVNIKNVCGPYTPEDIRDTSTIRNFGSTPVDESPYGYTAEGVIKLMQDGMTYSVGGGGARDWGNVSTLNFKFDLTSQIDRYNQIKIGLIGVYDDLHTHYEHTRAEAVWENRATKWDHFPIRAGAYIQDKLEFEGMIANFGLRLDYNDPNCEWFSGDRYSEYFTNEYKDVFFQEAPQAKTKGKLKISPRLGVSHPISENAKLYFNYGHFYSMPRSSSMYRVFWARAHEGIQFLGNPSADLPRTVSYELGVEYNVRNLFLIHLSGYYKDVTNQTGTVEYTSYDGMVDYGTTENNQYADIRGFELRLDKRFGRWITGWINYNYMVTTSGRVGRRHYYEDEREQAREGLQDPYQERPLARPVARANVRFRSPRNWGPTIAGINPIGDLSLSLLFSWRAGRYMTWDPLETYELQNNLQWRDSYNLDARFSKRMQFGRYNIDIFADVQNILNTKYINTMGFGPGNDSDMYYKSLRLPMYESEDYEAGGYKVGNDKPGDFKSEDKPYIDMPNRDYLTFTGLRTVFFGLKINF